MSDSAENRKTGTVYLVGAGPGDPGLMTLRGTHCLARADVVFYDYLVNPRILGHVRPGAELVCLGRHGRSEIWSPEKVNRQVVQAARAGKTVVRLKGGDPMIFGRGAEEVAVLTENGIPFEIVPGITAGLAASSYAAVPVTHRGLASAVAFVTGRECADKEETSIDYQGLARFPGTLVFYMGVTTADRWTTALLDAGMPPQTPVALVRRCSCADQQTVRCRLDEVVEQLTPYKKFPPPVIAIIGQVAEPTMVASWFELRPLFGVRVLVTRPVAQAATLCQMFNEQGAACDVQPAIEISDPADWGPVDDALARLEQFDWLVFSSVNGVQWFLDRLLEGGRDLRSLSQLRLAAVGPGTADQLARYHLCADVTPSEFRAESLAAALEPEASGRRFLLARASRGREVLAQQLRSAGAHVEQIVVYRSADVQTPDEEIARRLAAGDIDWITVTSSAIARSLAAMFGQQLHQARLASISPITSDTLRQLGFEPAAEATQYTMQGVVDAVRGCVADHADGTD